MKPIAYKTRFFFFALFVLLFLTLIPVVVMYSLGYRITQFKDGIKVSLTGGAYVYYAKAGAQIYVNNQLYGETSLFRRGIFVENLKAGSYEVKLEYPESRPWVKQVLIEDQHVVELYPYLIRENIATSSVKKFLTEEDAIAVRVNPQYEKVVALFVTELDTKASSTSSKKTTGSKIATTTAMAPISSKVAVSSEKTTSATTSADFQLLDKQGNIEVVKTGTSTYAAIEAWYAGDLDNAPSSFCLESKCTSKITLIPRATSVKNVQFFFGRSDVIFYSNETGIYSLEFDSRIPRNIFKIIDGKNLEFRILDDKTIVVKDKDAYYTATIL